MECTSSNILDVWRADNDVAFAVGEYGMIFGYKDGEWNPMLNGVFSTIRSVWGSSETDVFAVGDPSGGDLLSNMGVFHFDGTTWSPMGLPFPGGYFTAVWGRSGTDVYILGRLYKGELLVHYDGNNWTKCGDDQPWNLYDIWTAEGADVYAVGEEWNFTPDTIPTGIIARFDGMTWDSERFDYFIKFTGVWGSAPNDIYAVGVVNNRDDEDPWLNPLSRGTILHFDGTAWNLLADIQGEYPPFTGVHGTSADDVYVSGENGTILKYDGTLWRAVTTGTANNLNSVGCGIDGTFISVGDEGTILISEEGTHQVNTEESLCGLNDVWGPSMNELYGVCKDMIISYDGVEWSRMTIPEVTGDELIAIWGSSSSNIFASTYYSERVYHYDGTGWGRMDYPGTTRILDFWGSSGSDVYGVGASWIMHFDGSVWDEEIATGMVLNGIWGSSADHIFAVGGYRLGESHILFYDGIEWDEMTSPVEYALSDVWGSSASDVYAVGGYNTEGTVIHYDGSGWSEVYSDASEPLVAIWGHSDTDIYVAGLYSHILHYDGTEWHEISVPFDWMSCIWGDSENNIIVGGRNSILRYGER